MVNTIPFCNGVTLLQKLESETIPDLLYAFISIYLSHRPYIIGISIRLHKTLAVLLYIQNDNIWDYLLILMIFLKSDLPYRFIY